MIKFVSLTIDRQLYGLDKGKILGIIKFENQHTEMTVKLDEAKAQQMLKIVAEQMAANAREYGTLLSNAITNKDVLEIE